MDLSLPEAKNYIREVEQSLVLLEESEKNAAQRQKRDERKRELRIRSLKRFQVKGLGLVITDENNMAAPFERIPAYLRKDGVSEDLILELRSYFRTRGVLKNWSIRTGDRYDPYAAFVNLPDHLRAILKNSFARAPYFNDPTEWS